MHTHRQTIQILAHRINVISHSYRVRRISSCSQTNTWVDEWKKSMRIGTRILLYWIFTSTAEEELLFGSYEMYMFYLIYQIFVSFVYYFIYSSSFSFKANIVQLMPKKLYFFSLTTHIKTKSAFSFFLVQHFRDQHLFIKFTTFHFVFRFCTFKS
jgi:hypothetical protein